MTWINYHHLFYFKTIAELGSISKAAEKLRLGQPTLSSQLKSFEENLGVQLFERHHKKLLLTEHGKLALDYARNIFGLGDEMYEALHDPHKHTKLTLNVAALDSIPKQVVLQLTQAALKIASCKIVLIEGKFEDIMTSIRTHKVDIAITNFLPRSEEKTGIMHRSLIRSPVSFFGAKTFEHLKKNFPHSLSNEPIVLPTFDSKLRFDIENWFKLNNISVNILAETQDIALKKLMCIDGLALIPASVPSVMRQLQSDHLIEIGRADNVMEELFIMSAERKIVNPIATELMRSFTLPA